MNSDVIYNTVVIQLIIKYPSLLHNQVQLLANEQLIEKLTEELQAYCNTTPSSHSDIGDLPHYCAVRHNGVWYRAKLLDTRGQVMLYVFNHYSLFAHSRIF